MNRAESMLEVDRAIDHLMSHPDVLVDLASGRRAFMLSEWGGNRGSIAFSGNGDLSIGWREFARASDLVPFQIAIAKIEKAKGKHHSQSIHRLSAERFGWLLIGLARSADQLVELHQDAVNPQRDHQVAS